MSESNKKPPYKKWLIWLISIFIIGVVVVMKIISIDIEHSTFKEQERNEGEINAKKVEVIAKDKEGTLKITYENFLNIQLGQSYEEIINILGEPDSKIELASELGEIDCTWRGSGELEPRYLSVTFKNGISISKRQTELESMHVNISLDKYNQIKEGMTYEQTKEILGELPISFQTRTNNSETITYECRCNTYSFASFTFKDNLLIEKRKWDDENYN